MKLTSEFLVTPEGEEKARELYKILEPEVKSDSRAQSSLTLSLKGVALKVKALDRSAMRSAVNSYGRWIRLYEEIGGIE